MSAQFNQNPPKPVLTLRVGITGHRPKPARLPIDAYPDVMAQLTRVFEAIDATLTALRGANSAIYADEQYRVRLVSSMAEGADQLGVAARPKHWNVEAILPFPRGSYRKDFRKSAADEGKNVEAEFDAALAAADTALELPEIDDTAPRDLGYERLGAFLVRQIDLLVAVWDGKPEEGIGGTATVIKHAMAAHVPVVWIFSKPAEPSAIPFPRMIKEIEKDGTPVAPAVDAMEHELAAAIESIILPPSAERVSESESSGEPEERLSMGERLSAFFAERWPAPSGWALYDLLKRRAERKKLRLIIPVDPLEKRLSEWDGFFSEGPTAKKLEERLRTILLPRYLWADQLAVHFANRYRSAYLWCYLLSAFVVGIALVGVWMHSEDGDLLLSKKAILVAGELLLIGLIVGIYRTGRNHRWHERWLEYRALAEMLRDSLFLAYLAEYGQIQRSNVVESASSAWFLWYLRATVRELGLPSAALDGTFQDSLLTALDSHVINHAVTGQLRYHRDNAEALWRMNAWLRVLIDACFLLTLLFLFIFLVGWLTGFPPIMQHPFFASSAVTFAAAWLPALGAALAGIRETGDFEAFALRSEKTVVALKNIRRDIAEAQFTVTLADTSAVLFATARVLTEDLAAWQSVYGGKRLNLPL